MVVATKKKKKKRLLFTSVASLDKTFFCFNIQDLSLSSHRGSKVV